MRGVKIFLTIFGTKSRRPAFAQDLKTPEAYRFAKANLFFRLSQQAALQHVT
jgi:hypothetical protein